MVFGADPAWILRTSVEEWNARRALAPDARPDLAGADLEGRALRGADLSGLDLSGARLGGADLAGARLAGADLSGARLGGADLTDADLTGATLRRAFLAEARLAGARVRGAELERANLRGAELENADLRECNLRDVVLLSTSLRGADLTGCAVRTSELLMAETAGARLDGLVDLDAHRRANERLNDSSNVVLLILGRKEEEPAADVEEPVTKVAVALATLALLALCAGTAYATWDFFARTVYGIGPFVMIGLIIVAFLLPQVAYLLPRRWLPAAGLATAVLCGGVTGGFASFGRLFTEVVVAQTLVIIGVGIAFVMALSWLVPARLPVVWATAVALVSGVFIASAAFALAGSPWVVPFVAERGAYPPFPGEFGPEWIHGGALPMRLGMPGLLVLAVIALHQAVRDWRIVEERVERGLGKHMLWCAAAVLVGILPMAGLYVFLGSRSPKPRRAARARS